MIEDALENLAFDEAAAIVAFADVTGQVPVELARCPRAVSIAVALDRKIIRDIRDGPTLEYHAEYVRANDLLAGIGRKIAERLRKEGFEAIDLPPTGGMVIGGLRVAFPHKTAATRAGLGWIGKCALLITRRFGSAVRLTTVLTNAPLECAAPVVKSHCGKCRECVDICPARAISGAAWRPGIAREELVDVRACREHAEGAMEKLGMELGIRATICGMCIAACPFTRRYVEKDS